MTAPGELRARPVTPVGIVAQTIERVCLELEEAADLRPGLVGELERAGAIAAGMDGYLSRCTTPESPALEELARRTRSVDWSTRSTVGAHLEQEMLSGHVEGKLLSFLVRLVRARDVLEIGMFTGYSALAMAEALPPGGRVIACEVDPAVAAFAQECFARSESGHRIDVLVGPAEVSLARLAAESRTFDLVFLDADKGGYLQYLRTLLDTDLLAADGLVCVDNTLLKGEPYAGDEPSAPGRAIAAFNQAVADDPRVEQVLLPLRDGLTLIRRA